MAHRTRSILPLRRDGNRVVVDHTQPPHVNTPTLTPEQRKRNLEPILQALDARRHKENKAEATPVARDNAAESQKSQVGIKPATCNASMAPPHGRASAWARFALVESRVEPVETEERKEPSEIPLSLVDSTSGDSKELDVNPELHEWRGQPVRVIVLVSDRDDDKCVKIEQTPSDVECEPQTATVGEKAELRGPLGRRLDVATGTDATVRAELAAKISAKADELCAQLQIAIAEGNRIREAAKLDRATAANEKKAHKDVEKTLLKVQCLLEQSIPE